jgi:hypothetical protein
MQQGSGRQLPTLSARCFLTDREKQSHHADEPLPAPAVVLNRRRSKNTSQPLAGGTFHSEQTSHQQSASSTTISQQPNEQAVFPSPINLPLNNVSAGPVNKRKALLVLGWGRRKSYIYILILCISILSVLEICANNYTS